MELWDAYDADFNRIKDRTLVRGDSIPNGIFHLVCEVLVKRTERTYLLMQRDARKHSDGMWEATAGGSALQGEEPLDCAIRELREETGIVATALTEVGKIVSKERHAIYVEFLCVTDWEKEKITLQEGETSDFRWVSREELLHMKKDELVTKRMQKLVEELKSGDRNAVVSIDELVDTSERTKVSRLVLEALPDWFGIPEAREAYIKDSGDQLFFVAYDDKIPIGFLCLKETGKETVELAVMGVLQEYHRQGVGTKLFLRAKECAVRQGYEFMQVKTVQMGCYEDYDNTNRFYQSLGFKEFEVFPDLWGKENPCQVYVMKLEV